MPFAEIYTRLRLRKKSASSVLRRCSSRASLLVEQLEIRDQCSTLTGLQPLSGPCDVLITSGNLYVASYNTSSIQRYSLANGHALPAQGQTGATLVPSRPGDPAAQITIGPDGDLYASYPRTNDILRYDSLTGALLGKFASGGPLNGPHGLAFGTDANLYVANYNTNQILRYSGQTGAYLGVFTGPKQGPLSGPVDVQFGPEGSLYVTSFNNNSILRYDPLTGGLRASLKGSGLYEPQGLAFGPDGSLYVDSFGYNQVVRFAPVTGKFVGAFVSGLNGPHGLAFGPDGTLYISEFWSNSVDSYTGLRGSYHTFTQTITPTNIYMDTLDIARFEYNGTNVTAPAYSPLRLGIPLAQVDPVYDYDFAELAQVTADLQGVDRRTVLKYIFDQVTAGAANNTQRQLKVLAFLQQAGLHDPYLQPMYPDGSMVTDPLVLLELSDMRCGQVSRLAVDLFAAAGYPGRLVQLGGHVVAEIGYNNTWHYFDADMFKGGQPVFNRDGTIPSVAQMSQTMPWAIDALAAFEQPNYLNSMPLSSLPYPSYFYFSVAAYAGYVPQYIVKTSTPAQESASIYYGWENYQVATASDMCLWPNATNYLPGGPIINNIQTTLLTDGRLQVTVSWKASQDADSRLLGYHLYVSQQSRGWNYNGASLPPALMSFKSSNVPWNPSLYNALFRVPKSEVALLTTVSTSATFVLDHPADYYVTVMPYDAHGQSVGKAIYFASEEIKIPNWSSPM